MLLGNGDGTFQAATNYVLGATPRSIAVGDFNNDGYRDLAVASYSSNSVSVLLGNGNGTFQPVVNYPAGDSPFDVITSDFNGDGKRDLAVPNHTNNGTISLLLGNGDGTFQTAQSDTVDSFPAALAVGELNGDNKPDLVAANSGNSSVSVLLNQSTSVPTSTPTATPTATTPPTNTPTPTSGATATPTATPAGTTRIKNITFEGGSLTDTTSGADSIITPVNLETGAPLKGSYAARIPNSSTGYLREDFTGTDELFVSFYIKLNAAPASSARIAQISNSGTTVGNLVVNSSGTLQLRNGSTTIGVASAPMTVGTIYRVGIRQKKGTGGNAVLEVYLATGDAAFGAPFASSTSQTFTSQATRFSFGATNGNAIDATFDDIRLDTAAMPAP